MLDNLTSNLSAKTSRQSLGDLPTTKTPSRAFTISQLEPASPAPTIAHLPPTPDFKDRYDRTCCSSFECPDALGLGPVGPRVSAHT